MFLRGLGSSLKEGRGVDEHHVDWLGGAATWKPGPRVQPAAHHAGPTQLLMDALKYPHTIPQTSHWRFILNALKMNLPKPSPIRCWQL